MPVQKKYIYFKTFAPFRNLMVTCSINNPKSIIMGIKAGYRKKLPAISPFNNKTKLRCIPQPGQSK
jgi:hypothetical protein